MATLYTSPPPTPHERSIKHRWTSFFMVLFLILLERLAFIACSRFIYEVTFSPEAIEYGLDESSFYLIGIFYTVSALLPLPLSILADRVLDRRQAMAASLAAIGGGLILMAVPNTVIMVIGLALIVVGTGLFLPAALVYLGNIIPKSVHRKDTTFSWAYGALILGGLLAGLAGERGEGASQWTLIIMALLIGGASLVLFLVKGQIALAEEPRRGEDKARMNNSILGFVLMGVAVMMSFIVMIFVVKTQWNYNDVWLFEILQWMMIAVALVFLLIGVIRQKGGVLALLTIAVLAVVRGFVVDGNFQELGEWMEMSGGENFLALNREWLPDLLSMILLLGLGFVWLQFRQDRIHRASTLIKIGVGVLVYFLALILIYNSGGESGGTSGQWIGQLAMILFMVLSLPLTWGLAWDISPPHLRTLGMAMVMTLSNASFSAYFAYRSWGTDNYVAQIEAKGFLPGFTFDMVLLSAALILIIASAIFFVRNRLRV